MGWWINKLSGFSYFNDIPGDIIVQCVNIIFSFHRKPYHGAHIYALWNSGVNVFNVDRTVHDEAFFNDIKAAILQAEKMFDPEFYRPIGLSLTMSIDEPFEIDERVDILIIKDVKNKDQLREFKKQYVRSMMPILLWCTTPYVEDMKYLIKFSDGIVLDNKNLSGFVFGSWICMMKISREEHKSVFLLDRDMIKDYNMNPNDRCIINTARQVVNHRFDGIVLTDCNELYPPRVIVRAIATSMRFMELKINTFEDYTKLSMEVKTPVLPFIAVAISASLAALGSGASAILLLTASGRSARWIAATQPPCHVLAITTRKSSARRMHLYRKVMPLLYDKPRASDWQKECWNRIRFGTSFALTTSLFASGAKLVVLAPSEDGVGYCNSFHLVLAPFKCVG